MNAARYVLLQLASGAVFVLGVGGCAFILGALGL